MYRAGVPHYQRKAQKPLTLCVRRRSGVHHDKTGIGDAADQCPIEGDGQGLEIGFNNKYLMDALKAAPADKLRLEFSSGVAPCVILPTEENDSFTYMVLPVRLKAN